MLLTKIRLSGFKSFVDSAEIKLSTGLTAIVGPNGCGKSNIVDAVKWVLGEARISELRSGQSKDIIFNGSRSRAAAGRASVELLFDNSDGLLKGIWGGFSEISVRRTIISDGLSTFSINGQQVRKKDVQDLFAGTGLGPRAYAIVGQGSIKNIIEARPEELRFFVEEAAGVSKYRIRRKETENRLRDSKMNLLRVDDLIQELDKQIETLTSQAEAAAEYQSAVQKKLQIELEILTRKREEFETKLSSLRTVLDENAVELKTLNHQYEEKNIELTDCRNKTFDKQNRLNQMTEEFHELNSEIIRKESEGKLLLQSIEQLTNQISNISMELSSLDSVVNDEAIELTNAENHLTEIDLSIADLNKEILLVDEKMKPVEKDLEAIDIGLGEGNTQLALLKAEKINIEQKSRQDLEHVKDIEERLLVCKNELRGVKKEDTLKLDSVKQELDKLKASVGKNVARLNQERDSLTNIENVLLEKNVELTEKEGIVLSARASLEALSHIQEKELGSEKISEWLRKVGLIDCEKLISTLIVDEEWNLAVETVLDRKMAAIILESEKQNKTLFGLNAPFGTFFIPKNWQTENQKSYDKSNLGSVVSNDCASSHVVKNWLKNYLLADTDDYARENINSLSPNQYYITKSGNIYGRDLFFLNSTTPQTSILSREKDIHTLMEKVKNSGAEFQQLQTEVDGLRKQIDVKKSTVKQYLQLCEKEQVLLHEQELALAVLLEKNENFISREKSLLGNIEKLEFDRKRINDRSVSLQNDLKRNYEEIKKLEIWKEKQGKERENLSEVIGGYKEQLQNQTKSKNEKQLEQMSRQEYIAGKNERLDDLQKRKAELLKRKNEYSKIKIEKENATDEFKIAESLRAKANFEKELIILRNELRETTNQEKTVGSEISTLQDLIAEKKEDFHSSEIVLTEKTSGLEQIKNDIQMKLNDLGKHDERRLEYKSPGKSLSQLETELYRFTKKMEKMGPVNLAAETEITSINQRREDLISQVRDIRIAETELSQAIKKIDAETKDRMSQTMDQINKNLEFLFPKMFGGGQARLMPLEEDLLTAGMAIQAQLPGKKTMSIQSLSGGEKSMAAATLIFAFFLLNPAPFCLLDEVDAALDDSNTRKLSTLVVELSKKTQFIFITHNKISMEIASQLVGVTMREPGVSRIVSVDIESALSTNENGVAQVI